MKRRVLIFALTAVLCSAAGHVAAEGEDEGLQVPGEFSANVAVTTDYIYRGISQTGEDVALQAGVDWEHESGFYLGMWGSNVDFGDSAQLEIDLYGGYAGEFEGIGYDVGVLGYLYPGASSSLDYDFVEFYVAFDYDFDVAAVSAGFAISPEFFGDTGVGTHTHGGVSVPIPIEALDPYSVAVDANIGLQTTDDDVWDGDDSYVFWNVGLGAELIGFGLDFRYHEADVDGVLEDIADARFVFTLSRAF